MLVYKICKQYSHLLDYGKTYTGIEFASLIQAANSKYVKYLQNSKILFERTEKGIILDA